MSSVRDKIKALANFKGCEMSDITYTGDKSRPYATDEFEVDGETYVVMDEDEAEYECRDRIESDIKEMGLQAFSENFQEWILDNAIDQDYLRGIYENDQYAFAEDFANEPGEIGANRLIDECIDLGIISKDDLDENGEYDEDLVDAFVEASVYDADILYDGNFAQWYIEQFGVDDFKELCTSGAVDFDTDMIIDEVISRDGFANLAGYDGVDNELDGYHIFRV